MYRKARMYGFKWRICALCFLAGSLACHVLAQDMPRHVALASKRCDRIKTEVAKLRGLRFTQNVAMVAQSFDSLAAQISESFKTEYGEHGAADFVSAMVKIGALKKPIDMEKTILSFVKSQAAAHYDTKGKQYCLLMTNMPAQLLDGISSHELCHALQDQHFDLRTFLRQDKRREFGMGDRTTAKQCLVEGDATLVMTLWRFVRETGKTTLPAWAETMITATLRTQANMDFKDMIAMMDASVSLLPESQFNRDMLEATKELTNLPPYLVEGMFGIYLHGAVMVQEVRVDGGWRAVDALFKNPPDSTEQVLHPRKLLGLRDLPTPVELPELEKGLGESWGLVDRDTMGELGIRLLLRVWRNKKLGGNRPASAAAGWDGDQYYYFQNRKTDKDLLVWKTVWDSPGEAAEFTLAYRMLIRRRFPESRKAWRSKKGSMFKYQVWEVSPGRFLKLIQKDAMVGIVDSTDRTAIGVMWE